MSVVYRLVVLSSDCVPVPDNEVSHHMHRHVVVTKSVLLQLNVVHKDATVS